MVVGTYYMYIFFEVSEFKFEIIFHFEKLRNQIWRTKYMHIIGTRNPKLSKFDNFLSLWTPYLISQFFKMENDIQFEIRLLKNV